MPRRGKFCRICGMATIPTITPARLLQYLQEASADLTAGTLPWCTPEDQPGDEDPRVLVHRRDMALATLRWAISEATRVECALCERLQGIQARRQG